MSELPDTDIRAAMAEELRRMGLMGNGDQAPESGPVAAVDQLGAVWSPDLGAYAAGKLDLSAVRCALCTHVPCDCPPFGSPEYFALVDQRHGRNR